MLQLCRPSRTFLASLAYYSGISYHTPEQQFSYAAHVYIRWYYSPCHDWVHFQVVASDLSPSAVPIGDIDWSVPTAVVLGNEERGISDSMRNMADATFVIPMRGFVRSFNMSVACSIILAHLSAVRYCCIVSHA